MKKIDQALLLLHERLSLLTGEWMIIGTTSLYLSGYPVDPNDIDILCDEDTAEKIAELLSDFKVDSTVTSNQKFSSAFSEYFLAGSKIEVMGGLKVNTKDGWVLLRDEIMNPEEVNFSNKAFIVPAKTDQLRIYTLFNRTKDERILQMLS